MIASVALAAALISLVFLLLIAIAALAHWERRCPNCGDTKRVLGSSGYWGHGLYEYTIECGGCGARTNREFGVEEARLRAVRRRYEKNDDA